MRGIHLTYAATQGIVTGDEHFGTVTIKSEGVLTLDLKIGHLQ